MTTTSARADTLHQIRIDIQRISRARNIVQDQAAALERAADLFRAGLHEESRFVAEQGRAN